MAVKNHLKLIWDYFILNLKKESKYKASFIMQIVMMILNDLFFIIQWYIIFQLVDNIGGYGFNESLMLFAIAAGGFGFCHTFFGGAWKMKDIIYDGKLDVFLTQPKNVLISLCCSSTDVGAIGDLIYPFIVLIIVGAPWYWYLLMFPVMILSGLIYVASFAAYCSLCFHIKGGDAVAKSVEGTMNKSGNYPPAIYNLAVKTILYTIIPVFFYTFVPAEYIFFNFNIGFVILFVVVTIAWVLLAFFLFKLGLKKYNSGNLMGGRL